MSFKKENEWEGRLKPCHANKSQPLCLSRSQNQIWDAVTMKQGTRNVGERRTSCLRSSEVLATGGVHVEAAWPEVRVGGERFPAGWWDDRMVAVPSSKILGF